MFFTVKELVNSPGLPQTEKGIRDLLKKRVGGAVELQRKREGSKAYEYHLNCLPAETREYVRLSRCRTTVERSTGDQVETPAGKTVKAVSTITTLDVIRKYPAIAERKVSALTNQQRKTADARMTLVNEVIRLMNNGLTRKAAVEFIASESQNSTLPEPIQVAADQANARKGSTRAGVGKSSLHQWLTDYLATANGTERLALMAPGVIQARKPEDIRWLNIFLRYWRHPCGDSIRESYRKFKGDWARNYAGQVAMLAALPSYDAVIRAMNKLGRLERLRGRVTGNAWKALQPFVRRDWSVLQTNDVWIGDGHGMKMKIKHPIHGSPFQPELTLILDGVTRYVVGWSISFSENVIAICDALRNSVQKNGLPLFYYSDNGGGQKNKVLDEEITGILPRLGVGHETGIPENPQGRGIIERAHGTILMRVARQFATFNGKSADRDWVRKTSIAIESAVNAEQNGKELTAHQQRSLKSLPTWEQLIDAVQDGVDWYNNSHQHSSLPKMANGQHYTPAQYRAERLEKTDIHYLSDAELNEMFRPAFVRPVRRGEVLLLNNIYFSEELAPFDSEDVQVAVDIHDASKVIIRRLDGTYICEAIWDGNKRAAFPVSMVEDAREKRAKRRKANVERKLEQIEAERTPHHTIEHAPDFSMLVPADIEQAREEEPVFIFPSDRDKWLKQKKAM